jgi:type I restriction enzyme S subunit
MSTPRIDIRPDHWKIVRDILHKHVPQYEVWAFGSRAKWTAKDYSDLDLCVISDKPLSLSVSAALADDFSESDLPWKVDVVDWATTAESFRKIIERDKVVVQKGGRTSEWIKVTLDQIKAPIPNAIAMGPFGSRIKTDNFVPEGVPVIRGGNLNANRLLDDEFVFLTEEKADELKASNARPGDIVITHRGTIGQVGIIPYGSRYPRYVVSQSQMKLTVDSEKADPYFIFYYLRSPVGQHHLLANTSQVGVPAIAQPTSSLKSIEVMLPPTVDEQRAIAHILGTLDDKIELNRRMNETLEAIARAMFKSWFVDFDPVRAKMSGEPPESICQRLGLTPDLLALFPDRLVDSELGEMPAGWCASTLGSHIEVFDSKRVPLSNREREKRKGAYPYYGATSVMDYVDDFLFDGIYVLIGEDGSVVKENGEPFLQYVWGKFWVNNHAHVLQAKKPVSNEHLLLMLKQTNVTSFVTGAVQLKISQGNLKRIPFVSAPDPIFENFAKIIAPLFDMIRAREDETKTLTEVSDVLLPQLLTGELRVPVIGGL